MSIEGEYLKHRVKQRFTIHTPIIRNMYQQAEVCETPQMRMRSWPSISIGSYTLPRSSYYAFSYVDDGDRAEYIRL